MTAEAAAVRARADRVLSRARRRLGVSGLAAAGFLVVVVLVALAAPLIAPADPQQQDLQATYAAPSPEHLLGTDQLGRDIFSRLILGAPPSLLGPLVVIGLALIVSTPLALSSAWRGGRLDMIVGRTVDVMFAFPGILLAILAVALWGPGLLPVAIALAIAYTPWLARITRGAAVRERGKPYIAAGEVQGFSGLSICARHLLPNVMPIVVAQATILFGYAFVDLAALSFLGFGIQPPTPNWGEMVNSQDAILAGHPEQAIYAGALIVASVVAVTVLGNRLSEAEVGPARQGSLTESG